jgi:hypothetical protein
VYDGHESFKSGRKSIPGLNCRVMACIAKHVDFGRERNEQMLFWASEVAHVAILHDSGCARAESRSQTDRPQDCMFEADINLSRMARSLKW